MTGELTLALVGIGGTLLGTLGTALLQQWAARTDRKADATQERRRELARPSPP